MTKRWDAMVAKETNGRTFWTKLGVMWETKSGNGFNLVLDAIPVPSEGAYRISLFEPKENNNSNSNSNSNSRDNGDDRGSNSSYSSGRPGANRGQSNDGDDDGIPF